MNLGRIILFACMVGTFVWIAAIRQLHYDTKKHILMYFLALVLGAFGMNVFYNIATLQGMDLVGKLVMRQAGYFVFSLLFIFWYRHRQRWKTWGDDFPWTMLYVFSMTPSASIIAIFIQGLLKSIMH